MKIDEIIDELRLIPAINQPAHNSQPTFQFIIRQVFVAGELMNECLAAGLDNWLINAEFPVSISSLSLFDFIQFRIKDI